MRQGPWSSKGILYFKIFTVIIEAFILKWLEAHCRYLENILRFSRELFPASFTSSSDCKLSCEVFLQVSRQCKLQGDRSIGHGYRRKWLRAFQLNFRRRFSVGLHLCCRRRIPWEIFTNRFVLFNCCNGINLFP